MIRRGVANLAITLTLISSLQHILTYTQLIHFQSSKYSFFWPPKMEFFSLSFMLSVKYCGQKTVCPTGPSTAVNSTVIFLLKQHYLKDKVFKPLTENTGSNHTHKPNNFHQHY